MSSARTARPGALPVLIALCVLVIPAVSPVTAVTGDGGEGDDDIVAPSTGDARAVESPSVTYVDSCTTITEPGLYVLTADFGASVGLSGSCLRVRTSGVVVDGAGYTLQGRGVSDTTGIAVNGTAGGANVTVRNVTVRRFNRGIAVVNSSDIAIRNVTASHNAYGVTLENTIGARVVGNNLSQNVVGIRLTNVTDAHVVGNDLSQNGATGMVVEDERQDATASPENKRKVATTAGDAGSATDGDRGRDGRGADGDHGRTGGDTGSDGLFVGVGIMLTVLAVLAVAWRFRSGDV